MSSFPEGKPFVATRGTTGEGGGVRAGRGDGGPGAVGTRLTSDRTPMRHIDDDRTWPLTSLPDARQASTNTVRGTTPVTRSAASLKSLVCCAVQTLSPTAS